MSEVARAGPPTRVLYPTSSPNLDQSSNSHAFTHGGDAQKENSLPRGTQSAQNVMLGSPSKLRGSPNPNLLATPGARWEHGHLQNEQPADDNDAKGSWRSWKRGEGLQPWEIEIANSPEVRRKANVAQLYFLNHYFDSLRYLADRKARLAAFQSSTAARGLYLNGSSSSSASDSLPETPEEAASAKAYAVERASYLGRERAFLRKRRTALRLAQFHIITQIGQGGYGAVYLARKRETGEVCALKRLKKKVLVNMNEVSHVLTERDILTATRSEWLVRLLYAFQDKEHVFLAMEYVPGGDFRTLLNKSGVLFEDFSRFYAAEMFVAVNELHKLGYIHRDLKPENFLVDQMGHIKLTDFGLASGALNPTRIESLRGRLDQVKDTDFVYRTPAERGSLYKMMRAQNVQHADSLVGSPDYMAPEVLRRRPYGASVDYWSLGCILFECMCGFPPFSGKTPDETWANLKNWYRVLERPVYEGEKDEKFNLSDVAWDAVTRFITTAERRLNSLSAVQAHPYFAPLDMTCLREYHAPFFPELSHDADPRNFDNFQDPKDMEKYKEVIERQKHIEALPDGGLGNGGRGMWAGFTFGKNGVNANGKPALPTPKEMGIDDALATMF